MHLSLQKNELLKYTSDQLNYFYPDRNIIDLKKIDRLTDITLDRLEFCFKHVSYKRYNDNGYTQLNHLYADHYLMYIWFLASTIWKEGGDPAICSKLYYLNKTLHGLDCMYDTLLPDIFLIIHGVGAMLGKAKYADFFVALQGVTVGSQHGIYPVMDKGVSLTAHSSVIGNCKIGKQVSISAYTNIFETHIPDNSIVYRGKNGGIIIKESKQSYAQSFFNVPID